MALCLSSASSAVWGTPFLLSLSSAMMILSDLLHPPAPERFFRGRGVPESIARPIPRPSRWACPYPRNSKRYGRGRQRLGVPRLGAPI